MYNGPFKWWVQSVMPLVFDDSLSYYEVLAKLTKYIEGLTGDVQEIEKVLETIEGIGDVTEFTKFLETIQAEIGNLNNLQTVDKTTLVNAINEIALKANNAYIKPSGGIPESDLNQNVQDKLNRTGEVTKYIINNKELKAAPSNNSPADLGLGTYSVPTGGIPWDTLSQDVQDRINAGGGGTGGTTDYTDLNNKPQINGHTLNAGNNTSENLELGTYSKPSGGIPETDLSAEVQEKLNTSGGIADSETSFVATRDYEAGELVYINGILYKTKYKILSGTNLIPGNNIEVTDISAEIEKINSDIEVLQSGSGPNSWTLSTNIENPQSGSTTRFFEYFNCIGNESYLFIVTPVKPFLTGAYYVYVRKRDGSEAHRVRYEAGNNETQHRFTFVPTDTGEYYCEFESVSDYSVNVNYRIEIEYTESQGISELWNKVNEATQLEPRVSALETLVGEQQTGLDDLKSAINPLVKNTVFRNGSLTNNNNANAITTINVIPKNNAESILIKLPELESGYSYRVRFRTFSSESGTPIDEAVNAISLIEQREKNYFVFAVEREAKSFAFDLWKYDDETPTTYTPLRVATFDADNTFICFAYNSNVIEPQNYFRDAAYHKTPLSYMEIGNLTNRQCFTFYNNKIYSVAAGVISVQDQSFVDEQTVSLEIGHGNAIQLQSDLSGVAFISGWNDDKVHVVNLNTLALKLDLDLPVSGYTTVAVDDRNNLFYIFYRADRPNTVGNYEFITYNYATQQIIARKTINAFSYMQACVYKNGLIYVMYGPSSGAKNGMFIYNTNGDLMGEIALNIFNGAEPEGIYIDDENIYVSTALTNSYPLFKII